jgi:diguanylate cyclase (GGDEF)-like protein/PAS domain S-box-containing protein
VVAWVFSTPKEVRSALGDGNGLEDGMAVGDTTVAGMAAFRVMFEHSSEGVLFCTQDGRITAANPAACAMLDMSAEEICRLGRDGLVDQEDARWDIAVAERERTGSAVGVARLRRGDGRYMEIEMTALEFRDEDDSSQMCCILHDLTGRMAIEREIEELSARLLQLSRGDELTGLQNRRGLVAAGTQLLQFADRESAPVQVLFVDVANVQVLNEHLGHHAGDAALQAVARTLSVTFHKHDVLARIGGTQFLVLSLHLSEPDCGVLSNRIQDHLGAPETTEFVGAAVEVCCGWTTRQVGDRTSLEDLVARSDWAMLESREGRQATWEPLPAAGD